MNSLQNSLTDVDASIDSIDNKVSELDRTTASLSDDIDALNTSIDTIKNDITAANSKIAAAQTSISGIQAGIATLQAHDRAVLDVVAKLTPSVVEIVVSTASGYYGGTGVIIRNNGYVLTAYHVISDADSITVTISTGEYFNASVVAGDPNLDVAVIKISSTRTNFPFATLGSSSSVQVGEEVLAIGYPMSDLIPGQPTVTKGIVSAVRTVEGYNYIQTDTAVNPGNSGGPLVNMKGEVIGIVDWKLYYDYNYDPLDGLSFAVPIDDTKYLVSYT